MTLSLVGALFYQTIQYQAIARSQALLTEGYLPLTLEIDRLREDQQRITNDLGRLLRQEPRPGRGDSSSTAIHSERLQETASIASVRAKQALRMANSSAEVAVLNRTLSSLDRIAALIGDYQSRAAEYRSALEGGNEPAASLERELMSDERALEQEVDTLSQLLAVQVEKLGRTIDDQRRRASQAAAALALGGSTLALASILAVLASLRPLERLTLQAKRLAAGDYDSRIEPLGTNEIGSLALEFNAMAEALQQRDRSLVERADQLNRLSRYLGSVLDQLQDGLIVVENGSVTLTNPAAEAKLGVVRGAPIPVALADAARTDGYHELRVEGRRLAVRVAPFGESGRLVLSADVTDQRAAEEALARSERLALVGQMLAQITHEVRNPLNALSLNAEMLSDELAALDPERQTEAWDLLATVSGEIERLTQVTAHYLQLARRPPARLAATHLGALCADIARLLDAELHQQGAVLRVEVDPEVPAQRIDGGQVRQALLNIIRNATEAGATELALRVRADEQRLLLTLTDNGPGMDDQLVERAFDPFYSTKAQGTGLGLAITRQILEDHDGAIGVRSAPGAGTTLELVFPRRDAVGNDVEMLA